MRPDACPEASVEAQSRGTDELAGEHWCPIYLQATANAVIRGTYDRKPNSNVSRRMVSKKKGYPNTARGLSDRSPYDYVITATKRFDGIHQAPYLAGS